MNEPKSILFINSEEKMPGIFTAILAGLQKKGYQVRCLSGSKAVREALSREGVAASYLPMPKAQNLPACLYSVATMPLRQISNFIRLLKIGKSARPTAAIVSGLGAKFMFTRLLSWLSIKTYWIEWPEADYAALNAFCRFFYSRWLKKISILAFSSITAKELERFHAPVVAHQLPVALIPNNCRRQDSIFEKIASRDKLRYHKKFFTVGTVVGLQSRRNLELLFGAIEKCLPSSPNVQLVIVGEIKNRRETAWLAKKMEIDSVVWFVGEQKFLGKWLDSFDLYVALFNAPGIDEFETILRAMSASLPVIAPAGKGLEGIIIQNKNGALLEMDNSEMLARQIIRLHRDRKLCSFLGQNAKAYVDNFCSFDKMLECLESIFNYQEGYHERQHPGR